jgi:hypothetical protein
VGWGFSGRRSHRGSRTASLRRSGSAGRRSAWARSFRSRAPGACALAAGFEATRPATCRSFTPPAARPRAAPAPGCPHRVEAALSLALLAGAGLLARSFYALQFTNPGFDARHVVTTRISVTAGALSSRPRARRFYDLAVERVKALPGVEDASVVDWLPASGFGASVPFRRTDGRPRCRPTHWPNCGWSAWTTSARSGFR